MLNRTKPTTLLELSFKRILISKVTIKSNKDPDENVCRNLLTCLPSAR